MPAVAVVEWLSSSGLWSGWCGELSVVVFDALVLFSIGGKAEARAVANLGGYADALFDSHVPSFVLPLSPECSSFL